MYGQAQGGFGDGDYSSKDFDLRVSRAFDVSPAKIEDWLDGNRPLEPKVWEVEFFPMEEVLYEEIEI